MVSFVNIPHGNCHPLGATCYAEGVNFSVFSKNARQIDLLLFDNEDDAEPSEVYKLDPQKNRTFYYWHIFLPDINPGQLYGYFFSRISFDRGIIDGSKMECASG
jgi:glycogen operon protein